MPPASNSIATRQHTEVLWRVTSPIAAGQTLEGNVRDVKGYSLVNFLVLANDAVILDVEEANAPDGVFSMTASYQATLDPNDRYVIREQYQPSGPFARAKIHNSNPGPVTQLDLSGLGLPYGGGGAGSGLQGPQGTNPGIQGPQGIFGFQGAVGAGLQGPTGPIGNPGVQGVQGIPGFQGASGSGVQGNIGPQGSNGVQGASGSGAQGNVGLQGSSGVQGAVGNQGLQGHQGSSDSDLPADAIIHNLFAQATIVDTTPIYPTMTYDGADVSVIPVSSGKLVITDLLIGLGFVYWAIEVDRGLGGGFVTLANFGFTLFDAAVTEKKTFKSPIIIDGGTGVQVRLKVTSVVAPTDPVDVCITLRSYTIGTGPAPALPSNKTSTIITLTDLATTIPTEEVLHTSENAGTPSLSIPVPAGTVLEIDDYDVACAGFPGAFRLQHTSDGVNWFNFAALQVAGFATGISIIASPKTSWRIVGGALVAVRITATTPDAPIPVAGVLSGYRYS